MIPISDSIPARRFPFVNVFLIGVTVYIFFLQITAANPENFILQYALIPSQVNTNDWITFFPFITAIFLHGGFLHIVSNMLFLWVFGDNVEGYLGWILYPVLYFTAGIVGNALQFFLMPHSSIPMLGASGAVAGVLGAYYVLFPHSRIKTLLPIFFFITFVDIPAGFMLGYWFILQLLSGAVSLPSSADAGGVAFWAHVGGFMTGIIFARMIKPIVYQADELL